MSENTPSTTQRVSRRALLRGGVVTGSTLAMASALPTAPAVAAPRAALPDAPLRLARVWTSRGMPEGLDFTHRTFGDGSAEVVLWPGDLERLRAAGVRVDVGAVLPVGAPAAGLRTAGLRAQPGERTDYRRLADVEADLRKLVEDNPTKARLFELP